jgi:hypothetical protein
MKPSLHRRVKSLQATPSPRSVAAADSVFWAEPTDQFEAVYCRPIQECCLDAISPDRSLQDNWNLFSTPGWCCNDITAANTFDHNQGLAYTSQDCNGYIDYTGQHHPHVPTNCQGCIFRQTIFDGSGVMGDEEFYYDSDYELYSRHSETDVDDHQKTPRSRRVRMSYPPAAIVDDQQNLDATEDSSPDRRTYMYDYFTRNQQQQIVTPLRTGVNATADVDVAQCVQVSCFEHLVIL